MQRVQRSILLTALLAGCALAGAANAQVIRITNVNGSTGHDIPLKANSSVQIDSAGNLLAECALNSSNVCTALSTGGGTTNPNAPTAALTRADQDADVRTGENIRLAWSSTGAEACKATTAGPVSTAWSGVRNASDATGEFIGLSTVGTYTFSLVCYNAAGASTASTQVVAVTQAASGGGENPPPAEGCNITSNDPSFNPTNFARVNKAWVQTFSAPDGSPQATYPGGVSFPVPVGASKGTYVTVAFQPNANQSVNMYWDQIQSRAQDGYPNARPAFGMFMAISPCPGDLRNVAGVSSADHFLRPGCRKYEGSGSLVWTTGASTAESSDSVCKLQAGQTYYLHILPANPEGGLQTGEHSCTDAANSAQGCDVGAVFQSGPG